MHPEGCRHHRDQVVVRLILRRGSAARWATSTLRPDIIVPSAKVAASIFWGSPVPLPIQTKFMLRWQGNVLQGNWIPVAIPRPYIPLSLPFPGPEHLRNAIAGRAYRSRAGMPTGGSSTEFSAAGKAAKRNGGQAQGPNGGVCPGLVLWRVRSLLGPRPTTAQNVRSHKLGGILPGTRVSPPCRGQCAHQLPASRPLWPSIAVRDGLVSRDTRTFVFDSDKAIADGLDRRR